jgi:DNA polymerase-3 subunit epsilon
MTFITKIKTFIQSLWRSSDNSSEEEILGKIDSLRFVVLDTETTGFDYEKDRILCIGAIVLQDYRIPLKESLEIFIQQEHYNQSTAQIHGILKASVLDRPNELEALQQFVVYLGDSIIVAHHAIFDVTMINRALERNGMPILKNKTLDTGVLYKKTLLNSPLLERKDHYSLDDLADKFDISKKDRHTAMGDAYITAIAFLKILNKLKDKKGFSLQQLLKY